MLPNEFGTRDTPLTSRLGEQSIVLRVECNSRRLFPRECHGSNMTSPAAPGQARENCLEKCGVADAGYDPRCPCVCRRYQEVMATFSKRFPRAVHVFPLHALRSIAETGALLGKTHLRQQRTAVRRRTTSHIDVALGLTEHVHFYLLRDMDSWDGVPILATQLLAAPEPPFPHCALEMNTESVADDECTVCLWNTAVSRPEVANVCKGGNWTRGTAPSSILKVWKAFRNSNPPTERARGYWNEPILVPTLRSDQVSTHLQLFSRAASGIPELLLRSPVRIDNRFTLWTFCDEDSDLAAPLLLRLPGVQSRNHSFDSYDAQAPAVRASRHRIAAYFQGLEPFPAALDFDARRSPRRTSSRKERRGADCQPGIC